MATPLLLVLLIVESTDLVFAVDSIPAIFAVTQDPFIVYTSNVFAILGLRSLYFLLAGVMHKFHYLKLGLSAVLTFVGVKMLMPDLSELRDRRSVQDPDAAFARGGGGYSGDRGCGIAAARAAAGRCGRMPRRSRCRRTYNGRRSLYARTGDQGLSS